MVKMIKIKNFRQLHELPNFNFIIFSFVKGKIENGELIIYYI